MVPLTLGFLSVAVGLLNPATASAGTFYYGTLPGTDVTYVDVTETDTKSGVITTPVSPGPFYGTPFVSANSLVFIPPDFSANSNFQAPPFQRTDGKLNFMVTANAGQAIGNMAFNEGGARSVGGISGTDATYVDVSAVGFLQVSEVDNVMIDVETINLNFLFDFGVGGNGKWRFVSEGADTNLWTGGQFVDINQELIDRGISFVKGATKVTVVLDNILFAQSQPLTGSLIDKKTFFTVTTNIPEPTSCVLALFGLMVGALVSRRSR